MFGFCWPHACDRFEDDLGGHFQSGLLCLSIASL